MGGVEGKKEKKEMAPSSRGDLQMTHLDDDMEEDVRLLDSYDHKDPSTASSTSIQVRVTGMTCAACSNSVEASLLHLPGVFSASVALLQNRADVVFDPRLLKVTLLALTPFSFLSVITNVLYIDSHFTRMIASTLRVTILIPLTWCRWTIPA